MNKVSMLKIVTSGLTGHRERDIAYLREQILEYQADDQLVAVLQNILGCLACPCVYSLGA